MNGEDIETRNYYSKAPLNQIWENIVSRNHPFKDICVYEEWMCERNDISMNTINAYFSKLCTYDTVVFEDINSEKLEICNVRIPYGNDKIELISEFREIFIMDKVSRLFYGYLKLKEKKIPSILWGFEDNWFRLYVKPENFLDLKKFINEV
ncbi:MAG: hypothetical protein PWP73_1072 [Methanococcus sp.]|jgi:hypothetical protein|uniref:Uncharacterized protein n=2 Tax=Methanococcus maripaludis TaxID=39152 RepID=A0A2Z5PE19_METMI|nr:hypothetical protein [Methanococcus maripaludis]AEK19519.1 hypothetical protein GYY_03200 [Methanococcus maripaludis X1]MDK2929474.1 hypothetical protein [Methanococcus sp.]BAP60820.1 hypothetical protein MMKA1_07030 [Methanococcus maripaludis KA1]